MPTEVCLHSFGEDALNDQDANGAAAAALKNVLGSSASARTAAAACGCCFVVFVMLLAFGFGRSQRAKELFQASQTCKVFRFQQFFYR